MSIAQLKQYSVFRPFCIIFNLSPEMSDERLFNYQVWYTFKLEYTTSPIAGCPWVTCFHTTRYRFIFVSLCCHVATLFDIQYVMGGNKGGNNLIFDAIQAKYGLFCHFLMLFSCKNRGVLCTFLRYKGVSPYFSYLFLGYF